MNVVLAGYQAISILHGGPNTQLRNTAKHLTDLGVNVKLFDPWTRLRKEECDLVHLFAANIGTYHLARELHGLGIPIVLSPIIYSLHSATFVKTMLKASRFIQRLARGVWTDYALAADICGWAGKILPNTQAEADLVVEGLGIEKEKVTVIPNGVDERFLDANPTLFKNKYGLENFILSVGHTGHRRKNVLALIQALGKIDHPAVIIGRIVPGEYGDACVHEASKHKHILLIDSLENDSAMLASAYAACDVFVLPSLFETPGIAALEAGLAGAKIVITKYGGTSDYFGELADYVDPHSLNSIQTGILNSLGKTKNVALRDHIRKEFLWGCVAERTAEIYKDVLQGKTKR